jgi:hypothetical protein
MRRVSAKFVIRRTACARAQFSGCSSTTNAHSETVQTAVCCQTLTLGGLSSRGALSMLVGALFKKSGLFLNRVVLVCLVVLIVDLITQLHVSPTLALREGNHFGRTINESRGTL